ncbi:nuclear pore complex protein NUP35-like [Phragmites australis]|uniref:nuclear pore complex protein NUP35-like n=1 Tax=Phragmites australis TaxID=29695 RepID=UPI002D78177F|nr:nuclear pore complex protein NUP35-like [Phragmites australis]
MASSSSRSPAASRRGRGAARQSPFFRDLASPIPTHRAASRFASSPAGSPYAAAATPPPPPLFTLDDRFAAADFSPDPTASDLLPVPSSPSPRAAASRSPSWDRSRGKATFSAPGSPMDGVVEPARKEVLALPPPSSPGTPPPAPAAEAQSPVTPAQAPARTEPVANGGEVERFEREEWVTVFGFSTGDTNLVLREFEKCGVILRHHSGPRDGNWIHILYQRTYDARKALQKNGIQLSSGLIVGVKPIDPVHRQQLDERFTGSNQGGFMVSLPSKSLALKSTGASNQLGALPRPYDPKANTNVNRDAGRPATRSVAAPAKSIVTNVMDLIFGI